jgi:hypothetical protein
MRHLPILPRIVNTAKPNPHAALAVAASCCQCCLFQQPDPAKLSGKLLWVDEVRPAIQPYVTETFAKVERVGAFRRMRGPLVIEIYALDLLEAPKRPVLDNSPPPELQ